jgi:hypothetical protein
VESSDRGVASGKGAKGPYVSAWTRTESRIAFFALVGFAVVPPDELFAPSPMLRVHFYSLANHHLRHREVSRGLFYERNRYRI